MPMKNNTATLMQAVICCLTLNQNPPALILHKHKHKRRQLLSLSLSFWARGQGMLLSFFFCFSSRIRLWLRRKKKTEGKGSSSRKKEGRKEGQGPKIDSGPKRGCSNNSAQNLTFSHTVKRTSEYNTSDRVPALYSPVFYLPFLIHHSLFTHTHIPLT